MGFSEPALERDLRSRRIRNFYLGVQMTEPTTQTLVELVASALDAQAQFSLQPSMRLFGVADAARVKLLDALEAQDREIERLRTEIIQTRAQADGRDANIFSLNDRVRILTSNCFHITEERDNLLEQLAASQKEGLELRAELAAIRAQGATFHGHHPVGQVMKGSLSHAYKLADALDDCSKALNGTAYSTTVETIRAGARMIRALYTSPVVDGNAGLVECQEDHPNSRHLFKYLCKRAGIELGKDSIAGALKKAAALSTARTQQAPKGGE